MAKESSMSCCNYIPRIFINSTDILAVLLTWQIAHSPPKIVAVLALVDRRKNYHLKLCPSLVLVGESFELSRDIHHLPLVHPVDRLVVVVVDRH